MSFLVIAALWFASAAAAPVIDLPGVTRVASKPYVVRYPW